MNATELRDILVDGLYAYRDAQDQARVKEKGTDERTNPYVTELGKPCDRALWRNLHDLGKEDFEPATLLTFMGGHAWEEVFARSLSAQRINFLREVRIEIPAPPTVVSGRLDFLLTVGDHLIELKSIGAQQLDMMIRRSEKGRDEHVSQLNGYLHATQLGGLKYRSGEGFQNWPEGTEPEYTTLPPQSAGFLVYGNIKPDWKAEHSYNEPIHVVPVQYDELRARRELDRLAKLWAQDEEPDIPNGYSRVFFPCGSKRRDGTIKSWCPHYKHCWEGR